MHFTIVSPIEDIEDIAVGTAIRDLRCLRKAYGTGRWRKIKGFATVELANGTIREAELQWYEASGIGRQELKIKRLIRQG